MFKHGNDRIFSAVISGTPVYENNPFCVYMVNGARCHPFIGSLCSRLFYENQLLNGVTAEVQGKNVLIQWGKHGKIGYGCV